MFILHKKCTLLSLFFLLRGLGAYDWRCRCSGGVYAGMGLKFVQEGTSLFAARERVVCGRQS